MLLFQIALDLLELHKHKGVPRESNEISIEKLTNSETIEHKHFNSKFKVFMICMCISSLLQIILMLL